MRAVGNEIVHPAADGPHQIEVRRLRVGPHVVDPARLSPAHDRLERAGVILDVEPVPHVAAVAVHRDRPSLQGGQDGHRNQLLRHLAGSVVVGAMADQDRQAEGAAPGPGEVVRGRLARRVGRVRPVRRRLGEDSRGPERSVDLVGRYVQEAEGLPRRRRQAPPVFGGRLEQRHRALDVGGHEVHGAVDRTVDVGLGREVDHRVGPRVAEDAAHRLRVPDVGAPQIVVRGLQGRAERFDAAGVGERVERHHLLAGRHQPPHHAGADEPRPARDQELHVRSPAAAA